MNRRLVSACICCFLALVGAGCAKTASEPVTITVNYPSAQTFYKLYGYAFEEKYPDITVQVVQDNLMDSSSPPSTDVVYMNSLPLLEQRVQQGDLLLLSPIAQKNHFKVNTLSPIALSLLQSAASGQLYGLAPTFHSDALFYNKKLFERYNIQFPQDQMSWEEVLELAERFPHQTDEGTPLYGMQMNYYKNVTLNYILEMGTTEGLSYIDTSTLKVTMNTKKWERIWNIAVKAFQSGTIYTKDESEDAASMSNPPFYMEEAAMTKASFLTAYNFEPFSKYPNGRTIDWGMVTVPVDPNNPTVSHNYSIYDIYGIATSTEHQEAAWKLIEFIVNDSRNNRYLAQENVNRGLPANLDYIRPIEGHDLSPLYRLKPATERVNPYLVVDASILDAFADVAQQLLNDVIAGKMTVEQALAEVDIKGQLAVDAAGQKLSTASEQ
ncbi:ABC transporter substrate-binding protein [Paenibacillus xylaniclasticus]|uniref:ABC transporter substrate-binding protein n=1 Tax=Paenibacillus xylaniclasticus TaxID=588083 RepID=UPI000FD7F7AF|nr:MULTISPECIES: ABC transporter substrate-binding protein [Paenibacillus]GFN29826.1 hypothetical protein PCURB6_00860 [Paenibacillus curdlanolyticus]